MKTFIPSALHSDGASRRCHILNLSAAGALLHVGITPRVHGSIELEIAGDLVAGSVVWERAARLGIRFDRSISHDHIDRCLNHVTIG